MEIQRRLALKKMLASFAGLNGLRLLTKANSNIPLSK
jgi:hypothetical protein